MRTKFKRLSDLEADDYSPIESSEIINERARLESDFYSFTATAWKHIEPSEFIPGWHIQAICEHLEEAYHGRISYMILNMPPRMGKSIICNVLFPAWVLANNPSMRLFYISYAEALSKKFSLGTRRLIASAWYQKYWGKKVIIVKDTDNVHRFETTARGSRFISTIGGLATGEGGNFVFCDDPNNAIDVTSQVICDKINTWWTEYISTRRDSPKGIFFRMVIQQRLRESDLSGFILSKKHPDLVHLCLPMEFEPERRCVTVPTKSTNGKKWKDPRKKANDLLWGEGFDAKRVKQLKMELGSYASAGQLQQRPAPKGGLLYKEEWFQVWDFERMPNFEAIYQSWDTAISGKDTAAYSACTTWGLFENTLGIKCIMLLDVYQEHLIYPKLLRMVKRMYEHIYDVKYDAPSPYGPGADKVIIESKATGDPLRYSLAELGIPISGFNPGLYGNKQRRAEMASAYVEVGRVFLRAYPDGRLYKASQRLLNTALLFPNDKTNDIIDSMSQLVIVLKNENWLVHSEATPREDHYDNPDYNPYDY